MRLLDQHVPADIGACLVHMLIFVHTLLQHQPPPDVDVEAGVCNRVDSIAQCGVFDRRRAVKACS